MRTLNEISPALTVTEKCHFRGSKPLHFPHAGASHVITRVVREDNEINVPLLLTSRVYYKHLTIIACCLIRNFKKNQLYRPPSAMFLPSSILPQIPSFVLLVDFYYQQHDLRQLPPTAAAVSSSLCCYKSHCHCHLLWFASSVHCPSSLPQLTCPPPSASTHHRKRLISSFLVQARGPEPLGQLVQVLSAKCQVSNPLKAVYYDYWIASL